MNTNSMTDTLFPAFINLCVQSSLILTAAAIALLVLRRRSPALRHQISAVALGSLLVLPLLATAPPIKLTLPTPRFAITQLPSVQADANADPVSRSSSGPNSGTVTPSVPTPAIGALTNSTAAHRTSVPIGISDAALRPGPSTSRIALWPRTPIMILAVWAAGAVILLVRFLVSSLRLAIIARRSPVVTDPQLTASVERAANSVGFGGRIRLISDSPLGNVSTPVTWGLLRPVILIPQAATEWPASRLDAVLLHEVAHIRRGDWAAYALARAACALFWFHPLCWYLSNRMNDDAERSCDSAALNCGVAPTDYAAHLVAVVRSVRNDRITAAALNMARGPRISGRIAGILDDRVKTKPASRKLLAMAAAMVLGLALPVAWLRPLAAQSGRATPVSGLLAEIQQALVYSGVVPVTGPGIEITLRDSTARPGGQNPSSALIHDRDINRLVNDLNAAGAEAVMVGDQRIGALTVIGARGSSVTVNGIALHPPYSIRAIGDTAALIASAERPGRVVADLRRTDPAMVAVKRSDRIDLPPLKFTASRKWSRVERTPEIERSTAANPMLVFVRSSAGQTPVMGSGVAVTLTDSARPTSDATRIGSALIHDQEIRAVIDRLRTVGAEDIAIGDHRIVATTGIQVIGAEITVNGSIVHAPFVVRAIGDPEQLAHGLADPNGAVLVLQRGDPAMVQVERANELHLPAAARPAPRFARSLVNPGFQQPRSGGPSGQVITLADGTGVELIAVGSSPTGEGDEWWRPDGTLLAEPPVRTNNRFRNWYGGVGSQYMARSLFFRLHSSNDRSASTTGLVVDPTRHLDTDEYHHGRDDRSDSTHLWPETPASGAVVLGFPKSETRISYRFGIATGPWQTVAVTRLPIPPAVRTAASRAADKSGYIFLTASTNFVYQDALGKYITVSLLGTHSPLGEVARRVIVLDADGREVPIESYGGDYRGDTTGKISASNLARVSELRLQTRPYQWAEFRDIRLQPKRPANYRPISAPSPLPAFSHTFSNGLTVSVPGVTERRTDGGRWWLPDGTPAPGPWREFSNAVLFEGRPPLPKPRAVLMTMSGKNGGTFSEAIQVTPESSEWQGIRHFTNDAAIPRDRAFNNAVVVGLGEHVRECTLRFGSASGPWKTVGSVSVPANVRHAIPVPEAYDGDIDIHVTDRPTLSYATPDGQIHTLAFFHSGSGIGDMARRIVAVDKSGKIVSLQITGTGSPTVESIGLSFSDTSPLARYNRFDLSTIKEFRLQTRPYEWAEFRGIKLAPGRP